MTDNIDTIIKSKVDAFIPPAPKDYAERFEATLSRLKQSAETRETLATSAKPAMSAKTAKTFVKPLLTAAAFVMLFAAALGVLFARPTLAAEIPVVNRLVYAVAPAKEASEADSERIEKLINTALSELYFAQFAEAKLCFREGCMNSRENCLAAAYWEYLLGFDDLLLEKANTNAIEIAELHAEKKAFRFTVRASLEFISLDGKRKAFEECTVRLWENKDGLFIERIEMQSADYAAFVSAYEREIAEVPESGMSFDLVFIDSDILRYIHAFSKVTRLNERKAYLDNLASRLEALSDPDDEKAVRSAIIQAELERLESEPEPRIFSVETAASELTYRRYLGRINGVMADFSDIMERNEDTDLFFYANMLEIELAKLNPDEYAIRNLKRGSAEVEKVIDQSLTALIVEILSERQFDFVNAACDAYEERFELTYDRERSMITAYSESEAGSVYCRLKPLAESYTEKGLPWQEANSTAYEALLAELREQYKDIAPATPTAEPTEAPTAAPNREDVTAEWLAAELMYRYYLGMRDLEQKDFSDIMERNANTDLFFYANQLDIAWIKFDIHGGKPYRVEHPVGAVYYWNNTPVGSMYVWDRIEDENEITLIIDIYEMAFVEWTNIESVFYGNDHAALNADLHRITIDKQRMIIVDYYPYGACGGGVYAGYLEPIAKRYRRQGMSWQEADRLAYEECLADFESWDRSWRYDIENASEFQGTY